jgi:cytochrome P450
VARRLEEPGDDLTSELLRIRAGDDSVLTLAQIESLVFGLLFAGHETTTAFITNVVRRLIVEGLWSELAGQLERVPGVVEELLRLDSSVIAWRRITTRDTELGGARIPAGGRVHLLLGSANHDETRFECPSRLDPDRANVRDHLAFGFGIHYCLGAALARLETRVAVECLLARFPALALADDAEPEYFPNVTFRGPRELWVAWG